MARKCDLTGIGPMSGNNVSHANNKTRRKFNPNLQSIAFYSAAMGKKVTLTITTATLRTINKNGGLDEFIANARFNKLTDLGGQLRRKVRNSLAKKGQLEEILAKKRRVEKSAKPRPEKKIVRKNKAAAE